MFLGCLGLKAQAPCSDFNSSSNPAGNWVPEAFPNGNVAVTFGSPNILDGSQYLILRDQAGGSFYKNSVDFKDLGKRFLGQCLFFDVYLKNDGESGQPYHPNITIGDGVHNATFKAYITITPGSGWVRIKAPIQLSSGGVLPSNSDGEWILNSSSNPSDFDNMMLNSTTLAITPDITGFQSEIIYFDNFCIKSCDNCSADFTLDTSFNTLDNTAIANLSLINPILSSTPGNPGPTYFIDWGDGTSSTFIYPSIAHNYSAAGTYTVCVVEKQDRLSKCKRCFTFCYSSPVVIPTKNATVTNIKSPLSEYQSIVKAELESGGKKDFLMVPNPAKNYLEIQTNLSRKETISVRIIDSSGKIVLEKFATLDSGHQNIQLNVEKIIQGTYIVEIKSNDKINSQKLIISR
ncbi:hypothetical protein AOB46_20965 [Chryseobacterium indologenes]|uniref:PKD domain-containing protein n=1 Tax=Chryseobacterium indologenes TaxID=253 RepID=A0A0N0ZSB0_CHRID|nr:hypothetical protein AOB46_20965 [Chryseobacterium indologenes]